MLSKRSCPQLAAAPLVATPQVTPAVRKSLIGGNPVPQNSRVGESNRTAVPLAASNSISSRRDVRTGNGLNVRAQATDLLEQLDLPDLATEMARDHLVEFRRLRHVHVERKAVFARDPTRLAEPVLVHHPGQKRTDG